MAEPLSSAFKFCPRCGTTVKEKGNSPFRCKDCDFNFYFSPTAAVGGIVANSEGDVLFLIRAKDPGKGMYGLPGGFVDAGETLESSLQREVFEETSLTVTESEYLCSFPNAYDYLGFTTKVVDSFFVCKVESFDSLKAEEGEVDGFVIAKPTEEVIEKMAFESNQKAIRVFVEAESNVV